MLQLTVKAKKHHISYIYNKTGQQSTTKYMQANNSGIEDQCSIATQYHTKTKEKGRNVISMMR